MTLGAVWEEWWFQQGGRLKWSSYLWTELERHKMKNLEGERSGQKLTVLEGEAESG